MLESIVFFNCETKNLLTSIFMYAFSAFHITIKTWNSSALGFSTLTS